MKRGIRIAGAVVSLAVAGVAAGAQGAGTAFFPTYTFNSLSWGMDADGVKAELAKEGFHFVKMEPTGDLSFQGSVRGYDAAILALMADGHLVKVALNVATPDTRAQAVFATMRDSLSRIYGSPTNEYRLFFGQALVMGEDKQDAAIKAGQARVAAYWVPKGGQNSGDDLGIEVTPNLTVQLSYESEGWNREADKRKVPGGRGAGRGGGGRRGGPGGGKGK